MSERKFDSHSVGPSQQACGRFWAFLPLGPLYSACRSASAGGLDGGRQQWDARRACCEKTCGVQRVEMGLFLQECFWRPPSPCPRQDYCWSRTRPPEFPSASYQLKALPGPLDRPRGRAVHGETCQPVMSISQWLGVH